MSDPRFHAMPRFVVAVLGHLLLFAWFRQLAMWSSLEHEMWKGFRIGSVALVILVCAASVVIRGTQQEKIAGAVLCILPGFCLISALLTFWSSR